MEFIDKQCFSSYVIHCLTRPQLGAICYMGSGGSKKLGEMQGKLECGKKAVFLVIFTQQQDGLVEQLNFCCHQYPVSQDEECLNEEEFSTQVQVTE